MHARLVHLVSFWRRRPPSPGSSASLLFREVPVGWIAGAWLCLACAWAPASRAEADGPGALGVSPTHVVFEGRTRTAEVVLINRGDRAATYRVSFRNLRMREDGRYDELEVPGPSDHPAQDLIRFAPREVHLAPGGTQTVRLMLRKPGDLAAGEYRSHLYFEQLPPESAGNDIDADLGPDQLSVKLIPLFGVSIPVLVRQGELAASVGVADLALLPPDRPGLSGIVAMRIHRDGSQSVRGDIAVDWQPRAGAPRTLVTMKGVSVLAPTSDRDVRFAVTDRDGAPLSGGSLRVRYTQDEEQREPRMLAEAVLAVP